MTWGEDESRFHLGAQGVTVSDWCPRDLPRMAGNLREEARLVHGARAGARKSLLLEAAALLDLAYSKFPLLDEVECPTSEDT